MSEKNSANYKLNKKIKDDTFNVDHISSYNLSLQVNPNLFRVCVTDTERNRCMLLEDYQFSSIFSPEQLISLLEEIYDDHHILKAGFWKTVRLALKTPNFSLVPNSLFDKDFAKDYLTLNCSLKPDNSEEVLYYKQSGADVVNIFSADKQIVDWFTAAYPARPIKVIHHTCPLIEGVLQDHRHKEDKALFIYVEKNQLTILILNRGELEFCNSFYFSSPEDFVYYVMFVVEQIKFDADKNQVTLWGDILPDSELYRKLFKYIRKINFGDKPTSLQFSYHFDEIFDHTFFDLYSMHLCE